MLYFAEGSPTTSLSGAALRAGLGAALDRIGAPRRVLIVPPDITRVHSRAGELTRYACERIGFEGTAVLPALGTHFPMSNAERRTMFGDLPASLFREHKWRTDAVTLGEIPADYLRDVSAGAVAYAWPVQVNRLLASGDFDLVLSIGQVVPHEVVGMASYTKNLFIGTGGAEGIAKSHFLGAAYGMERIMGRTDTPVRRVLDRAAERFGSSLPPVVYVHTVVARGDGGELATRGLFIGDGESFTRAAALSLEVNLCMLERPVHKMVVWLDPDEYRSTWLGNKSIYRTRMAMADGGEILVLAPGVAQFGEDPDIDALIRRHGYRGTEATLEAVKRDPELGSSLGAAAHMIHGSSEGRFTITYATTHLSKAVIEGVGFRHADLTETLCRYDPRALAEGANLMPDGEEIFFVKSPGLGLWSTREAFRR
jgi:nickel-dependent lactate racemase